jgi:tetratricopeptide (TPR) repeat protein
MRDRYSALIDQIVEATLKGKIRSKEQVYHQLVQEIASGTGEIFEQCLIERIEQNNAQLKATDDLKRAKAERRMRALNTIQGEWERYQKQRQATGAITVASQALLSAQPQDLFLTWLRFVDVNQPQTLTLAQLPELAQSLERAEPAIEDAGQALQQMASGLRQGLQGWRLLEDHLVRWLYESPRSIGFEGGEQTVGPWKIWADQLRSLPSSTSQLVFQTIAEGKSIVETIAHQSTLTLSDAIELTVLFQTLQRGLIAWFEKQPYDSKWGTKQAVATFLTFAVLWSQLCQGLQQHSGISVQRYQLVQGCFQMMLQGLRSFSQQPYFPLYGGVFALFPGDTLKGALMYLDEPLRRVEGTQEKARILTLLGYSQRALGRVDSAIAFHQQALEIAQAAGDQACAIANLNHLSRTYLAQKEFSEAIRYSQRALVSSRQRGDRIGEANALTNLGYSEVLSANQFERIDPDHYEMPISYLEQGLQLAEKLGDRQSQSLCYNSLGIAYHLLSEPKTAIDFLEKGAEAAQFSGDLYLQGLNFAYLAEAHHQLGDRDKAILSACLGMYLLEHIHAQEWRQPAGLLTVLQGQSTESLQAFLSPYRPALLGLIGVDGYDYLPQLLEQYRQSIGS